MTAIPAETLAQLLTVATSVLRQGIDLVDNVLTSDDQMTVHSKYVPGSTIGKHLRHVRDHFDLLLLSISSPPPYVLSYDKRSRNTPMESSRQAARESLAETISSLEQVVPATNIDEPMTLNAVTPHEQIFHTSFGRELWFAVLHAIHHWSMIRFLAGELGLKVPDDLGYAPSTMVYQAQEKPEKAKY